MYGGPGDRECPHPVSSLPSLGMLGSLREMRGSGRMTVKRNGPNRWQPPQPDAANAPGVPAPRAPPSHRTTRHMGR